MKHKNKTPETSLVDLPLVQPVDWTDLKPCENLCEVLKNADGLQSFEALANQEIAALLPTPQAKGTHVAPVRKPGPKAT